MKAPKKLDEILISNEAFDQMRRLTETLPILRMSQTSRLLAEQATSMTKLIDAGRSNQWLVDQLKLIPGDTSTLMPLLKDAAKIGSRSIISDVTAAATVPSDLVKQLAAARGVISNHEVNFRLPKLDLVRGLVDSLQGQKGALASYAEHAKLFNSAEHLKMVSSLHSPWMNIRDSVQSIAALTELHSLGSILKAGTAFDPAFTRAVRRDLGDWRKPTVVPSAVIANPGVRTAYYLEQGFSPSLTDMPEAAFEEAIEATGMAACLDDLLIMPVPMRDQDNEEGEAFKRTNRCHDYLQRFENRIRKFIHNAMQAEFGPEWHRRLEPDIVSDWEQKRAKAERAGYPLELLIEAADFTHYSLIICNRGLWREVFQKYFGGEASSVRESFQRLLPIRLATMHSRFVTPEDLIYVLSESTRLMQRVKKASL